MRQMSGKATSSPGSLALVVCTSFLLVKTGRVIEGIFFHSERRPSQRGRNCRGWTQHEPVEVDSDWHLHTMIL